MMCSTYIPYSERWRNKSTLVAKRERKDRRLEKTLSDFLDNVT